jgi:hypothetical protein
MVCGGELSPVLDEAELLRRRKLAVHWLEWACGWPEATAVDTTHERYRAVTEGRHGPGYSSCGDLAHWMLFRLGVRLAWINRAECRGWRVGANINKLVPPPIGACGQARPWRGGPLDGGDVLIIANKWPAGTDAHAVCVCVEEPGWLGTAEYGQPGGALKTHRWDGVRIGQRKVQTVLRLDDVLYAAWHVGLLREPENL